MKKQNILYYVLTLFAYIVLNIVHPITPKLVKTLGFSSSELPRVFGMMFAMMSLGALVSSTLWGRLGDRFGKRNFLLIGMLGYAAGQFMFSHAETKLMIYTARFISGTMIAAFTVNFLASILENTSEEDKKTVVSMVGAISVGALSLGYYLGGLVENIYDIQTTFYIQVLLAAICGIILFITMPNKIIKNSNRIGIIDSFKSITSVKGKSVMFMLISMLLVTIAFVATGKSLDFYFEDSGLGSKTLGDFVFWTGIVLLVATILVVNPLAKKFSEAGLLWVSLFGCAISLFLTFFIKFDVMISLYSFFMVFTAFKAFHEPLDVLYITRKSDLDKGVLMGIRNSIKSIAQIIAPLLGGYLYSLDYHLVFYVSAGLLAIASLVTITVFNMDRKEV